MEKKKAQDATLAHSRAAVPPAAGFCCCWLLSLLLRLRAGRTQLVNAEVGDILQSRTALLGRTMDLSTSNSLRVSSRHGASARPGELMPYPVPFSASQTLSAHDRWAARTVPGERTGSTRMGGAAAKINHPAAAAAAGGAGGSGSSSSVHGRVGSRATEPYNSRQTSYETEYLSTYCDAKLASGWTTKRAQFLSNSLDAFEAATAQAAEGTHDGSGGSQGQGAGSSLAVSSNVFKAGRPLSPTQPLLERISNERVSAPSLESMQRPVFRKIYPELDDAVAAHARPRDRPYSFDMRVHIERMRPAPLFKDVRGTVAQSESLQQRPQEMAETAAMYLSDRQMTARLRAMD